MDDALVRARRGRRRRRARALAQDPRRQQLPVPRPHRDPEEGLDRRQFCKELYSRPFYKDIVWQLPSGTRVEVIDDEVAEWLAKTNGKSLNYAPESGSLETRKRVKKHDEERVAVPRRQGRRRRHRLNGHPPSSSPASRRTPKKDLKQTVKLARKLARLGITDMAFGFFFPIPNTELYYQLKKEGRIELNDDFLLTPIFANEAKVSRGEQLQLQPDRQAADALALLDVCSTSTRSPTACGRGDWCRRCGTRCSASETRKMETFLVDIRRKIKVNIKGWLTGRKRAETARTKKGEEKIAA